MKEAEIILGESTLAMFHEDLPEKLRDAFGHPVMITISYIDGADDDRQLHHFMATSDNFPPADILPTLVRYGNMAKADLLPKNRAAVAGLKQQTERKKQQARKKG